ncbi:MAG: hypothetical protein IT289_04380 [Oligoflexia bacterium]|nr:hypothetical protein [Oligoflexia bacterium]
MDRIWGLVVWIIVVVSSLAHGSSTQRELKNLQIAAYHAPVLFQEVGGFAKADAITRFDFDGDWIANNNWENLETHSTPAFVYYQVIETSTHYFITYAFFHPRDYASVCFWKQCHENDLEGVYVAVAKTLDNPMGQAIATASIAHSDILLNTQPTTVKLSQEDIFGQKEHLAFRIEDSGHGVHSWDGQGNASNRLVYYYGAISEDPKGSPSGAYSYDLVPISELWKKRDFVGKGKTYLVNYFHLGARFSVGKVPYNFAGEKFGKGFAHTPWGWHDSEDKQTRMGDWFFDPALSMYLRLLAPKDYSLDYVFNPYIGLDD